MPAHPLRGAAAIVGLLEARARLVERTPGRFPATDLELEDAEVLQPRAQDAHDALPPGRGDRGLEVRAREIPQAAMAGAEVVGSHVEDGAVALPIPVGAGVHAGLPAETAVEDDELEIDEDFLRRIREV